MVESIDGALNGFGASVYEWVATYGPVVGGVVVVAFMLMMFAVGLAVPGDDAKGMVIAASVVGPWTTLIAQYLIEGTVGNLFAYNGFIDVWNGAALIICVLEIVFIVFAIGVGLVVFLEWVMTATGVLSKQKKRKKRKRKKSQSFLKPYGGDLDSTARSE